MWLWCSKSLLKVKRIVSITFVCLKMISALDMNIMGYLTENIGCFMLSNMNLEENASEKLWIAFVQKALLSCSVVYLDTFLFTKAHYNTWSILCSKLNFVKFSKFSEKTRTIWPARTRKCPATHLTVVAVRLWWNLSRRCWTSCLWFLVNFSSIIHCLHLHHFRSFQTLAYRTFLI